MFISKLVLLAAAVAVALPETEAHGYLSEPVNRGSAWRKGFRTPVNYNDNENFCGGLGVGAKLLQKKKNSFKKLRFCLFIRHLRDSVGNVASAVITMPSQGHEPTRTAASTARE